MEWSLYCFVKHSPLFEVDENVLKIHSEKVLFLREEHKNMGLYSWVFKHSCEVFPHGFTTLSIWVLLSDRVTGLGESLYRMCDL